MINEYAVMLSKMSYKDVLEIVNRECNSGTPDNKRLLVIATVLVSRYMQYYDAPRS